jgi:cytochrome c oxidase cbb3-type subunit 2
MKLVSGDAAAALARIPVRLADGLTLSAAQAIVGQLNLDGAKAEAQLVALGPDIQRNWGRRLTVAQDYLHDYPLQLGTLRLGPDLTNIGVRQPDAKALLQKLYHPQSVVPKSMMPPYRYLFEKRRLVAGEPVPSDAVFVLSRTDKNPGEAVIARPEAQALAAYLLSLRAEIELPNAPTTKVPTGPSTNAPAASVK